MSSPFLPERLAHDNRCLAAKRRESPPLRLVFYAGTLISEAPD